MKIAMSTINPNKPCLRHFEDNTVDVIKKCDPAVEYFCCMTDSCSSYEINDACREPRKCTIRNVVSVRPNVCD